MIARIPIRMAAALALTLGGITPAVLTAAAPAQAVGGCTQFEGHQIDSPPSILAWDYVVCGGTRTNLPVIIEDLNTDKVVAQGEGGAFYVCNGTALTKYAAAGASFQANCGGPA
jgi:hypothetical protein